MKKPDQPFIYVYVCVSTIIETWIKYIRILQGTYPEMRRNEDGSRIKKKKKTFKKVSIIYEMALFTQKLVFVCMHMCVYVYMHTHTPKLYKVFSEELWF